MRMPETLEHYMVPVRTREHAERVVCRIVEGDTSKKNAMCFVDRRTEVGEVAAKLEEYDVDVLSLIQKHTHHSSTRANYNVRQRMHAPCKARPRVLVCTELLCRGIDFTCIHHVINVAPPKSALAYVHRAGRTGRMGPDGRSRGAVFTVVSEEDYEYYLDLMQTLRTPFSPVNVQGGQLQVIADRGDPYRQFYRGRRVIGGRKWSIRATAHGNWIADALLPLDRKRNAAVRQAQVPAEQRATAYDVAARFVSHR